MSFRFFILMVLFAAGEAKADLLKINGSTTVNLPVAEAAEVLRKEKGIEIQVDTQGGSSGGISMLGEGKVHLGMASKPLRDEDRKKFPNCSFKEIKIGEDAVALIVSKDVWQGGVRSVSKQEVVEIYEGKIRNWKQLGGPDQRIAFFNKEPGRGTWEVFIAWAYGDVKKAPRVSFPEVGGNEEARNKVASTRGALSQLSSSWADDEKVFALEIEINGEAVPAEPKTIANGRYPLSRPLYILSDGDPHGPAKVLVDYLLSDDGQALVRKHGYLSLDQLKIKD